jgi:hypothetical protein
MMMVAPQGLLAMVSNPLVGAQDKSRQSLELNQTSWEVWEEENTHFGDTMEPKQEYARKIGFQNIGGVKRNRIKDYTSDLVLRNLNSMFLNCRSECQLDSSSRIRKAGASISTLVGI